MAGKADQSENNTEAMRWEDRDLNVADLHGVGDATDILLSKSDQIKTIADSLSKKNLDKLLRIAQILAEK